MRENIRRLTRWYRVEFIGDRERRSLFESKVFRKTIISRPPLPDPWKGKPSYSHYLKAWPFSAGLPGIFITRKASALEPALDGRARDSKEFCDLLSRDAAVDSGERLQPEVLRVGVHGHNFHVGSLLTQAAVRYLANGHRMVWAT